MNRSMIGHLKAQVKNIEAKAFFQGLVVVLILYGLLVVFIALKGPEALDKLESKLASASVRIEPATPASKQVPGNTDRDATQDIKESHAFPGQVSGTSLPYAPRPGLIEKTDGYELPRIGDGGLTPFQAYKKPYTHTGKPVIALAVLDFGLSDKMSNMVLERLPGEVSVILNPYSRKAGNWQAKAAEKGHETWLELPLQTGSYPQIDSGPRTLLANKSLVYNEQQLHWALSQSCCYAGIAALTDRVFANAPTALSKIVTELFGRGLGYLELNTQDPAILVETVGSKDKGQPYIQNRFLVNRISLKRLEHAARQNGHVMATVQPGPAQIEALQTWIATLQKKGFELAPVSALHKVPARRDSATTGQENANQNRIPETTP